MKNAWIYTITAVALVFIGGAVIAFNMIADNEAKKVALQEKIANAPKHIAPSQILDMSLVDPSKQNVSSEHFIDNFKLVDHNGDTVSNSITENKIYVTDYFFVKCGGICPRMTDQMMRVQDALKEDKDFVILSHTVWPEVDSVPVLKEYAEEHGAIDGKWYFLTGDKDELYRMARKSYFVLKPAAVKGKGDGNSDFIHTDQFVLIDRHKRIRGYYRGTDPEQVDKLINDAKYLLANE